ncbi:hypothetical protein [Fictibacillus phosphorivorans]|uniref:hypothetical protein n=1 Tax=Fictibacillus phosphorivorans TaxID=1221500 RepID=UPI002040E50A|nr:hypothetical protein [Fictibacillus phosphorivorans]MCM3720269.1 hypothetical protein [Fictibacillus phosphorivorans]MCM3777935.1 hypothetical protein [Fictibacillus phosphorivorans]
MNVDSKLKKKKNPSNRKAYLLPLAIVLLLIGLVVWNNIRQETKLPSKDWSRSVSIAAESVSSEPIAFKEDNQYHIYTHLNDGIKATILDEKLNVVSEKTEKLSMDERGNFWTNGKQIAFVSQGDLIIREGSKNSVIDKDVEILADTKERFAYTKDNEVYMYDPKNEKSRLIFSAKEKISELNAHPDSSSFIAVVGEKVEMEAFYLTEKSGQYEPVSILKYSKTPTDKIYNFRFAESNDGVHILYTFYSTKQGTKSFKTYYGSAPKNQLKDLSFSSVTFKDEMEGYEILNPNYLNLYIKNGVPSILFSARGAISNKKDAGNIYQASLKGDTWQAKRISTTNDFSIYPVKADDQTIFWLKAESVKEFQVYAASQDPSIIKSSQSISKQDVYNATFDAFAASIVSFIAMTNAFVWIVPTILFLGILYVVRIDVIEEEKPWVKLD